MILSDHSIREALAAGRIELDPSDDSLIQPASVDVRLDRFFRVFLNHTMPVIDVKKNLEELTRLVEIEDGNSFVLHPGEFVLGSTLERVALADDLVARIEGKSSLGRLGLLIHSSLPAGEELLVCDEHGVQRRTIGQIVKEQKACAIVGFDPETFEVGYHEVTGFYEGPEDKIYEVRLASGRRVRVTAGHNLFTVDDEGELRKVRTAELAEGVMVAVARHIPDPSDARAVLDVRRLIPEEAWGELLFEGPTIERACKEEWPLVSAWLSEAGYSPHFYRARGRLPCVIAMQVPGVYDGLGADDFVRGRGERHRLPLSIEVDEDLAWTLGMYVAEGHRRDKQVNIANTQQERLDRLEATFARLGIPVSRSAGSVTVCSKLVSRVFSWMGMGGLAPTKRAPVDVFGWPTPLIKAFLAGLVDGDGSFEGGRTSVWTTSDGLVSDVLLLFARLGRRAGSTVKQTPTLPLWQVYAPANEHKLLTTVPLPGGLLRRLRAESGVSQRDMARLAAAYAEVEVDSSRLDRLVTGDLAWDRVVEVVDTGEWERIYDIEVRPSGKKIQNFLAGRGGVFVANTAGFIDPGFDGHITLELSNVANLPITLYPGMKIGQISFLRMTTPADVPYGQGSLKSKYQGQRGPTPSRYWENFEDS